jgi:hypothetical protein
MYLVLALLATFGLSALGDTCSSQGVTSSSACNAECGGSSSFRSVNGLISCTCPYSSWACADVAASTPNVDTSSLFTTGTIRLSSTFPEACEAPGVATYECSREYNTVTTGDTLVLTPTPKTGYSCLTGEGTIVGTTVSGSFGTGNGEVTFQAQLASSGMVEVITNVEGLTCTGTYEIIEGNLLGAGPGTSSASTLRVNRMYIGVAAGALVLLELFLGA